MLLVVKIIGTDFRKIVNNSYIRKIYSSLSSNLEKTQMKLKQDTVLKNGEYKIIKTLGQGGFGITYLAYQIHLKRNVVIKEFFIKEYCDRDSDTSKVFLGTSGNRDIVVRFLNKFHNEALNIAALKHPNIISIYDVFEENNTAYYVMEYHPNGSLGRLVDGNNGMSKERALHYIYQVADVLKYIHSKHIMHLDIKPDNILLDENDNAILIDFGLAKVYDGATNQQQTRSSSIAAYSPGYAPLEQYNPSGISSFSPTTDIYSLGATLFTLLTGKCPPLAIELINNDFIAQELLRYNVDKAIIDTIVRSMSPTTVQRPQSIGEFLAMLDAGETAVPQPASRITPQDASHVAPQPVSQVLTKAVLSKKLFSMWAKIVCGVIILAAIGIGGYLLYTNNPNSDSNNITINPEAAINNKDADTIAKTINTIKFEKEKDIVELVYSVSKVMFMRNNKVFYTENDSLDKTSLFLETKNVEPKYDKLVLRFTKKNPGDNVVFYISTINKSKVYKYIIAISSKKKDGTKDTEKNRTKGGNNAPNAEPADTEITSDSIRHSIEKAFSKSPQVEDKKGVSENPDGNKLNDGQGGLQEGGNEESKGDKQEEGNKENKGDKGDKREGEKEENKENKQEEGKEENKDGKQEGGKEENKEGKQEGGKKYNTFALIQTLI